MAELAIAMSGPGPLTAWQKLGTVDTSSREHRTEKTEHGGAGLDPRDPRRSPVPGSARPGQPQLYSAFVGLPPHSRNHPEWGASGVWGGQNEAKAEMGF